MIEQAPF
jgi:hypothetical protein